MMMFLNLLLLLFCFISYSGTPPVGTTLISVIGKKGGNAILSCKFDHTEISDIVLSSLSKIIPICENKDCENGRAFKTRNCDIILMDLKLSDAGKYILRIYYKTTQSVLEQQIRTYQLHIHDEISVKISEELKLDVPNADKVEHQPKSSTEWSEVWKRSSRVQCNRMTDTDGNLIIKVFTASDAGTYRVLDFERNILITVTVTESKGKLNYMADDKPNVVWFWTSTVVLPACACFWFCWFLNCFRFLSSRNVCL
ncbi:uncharacterized protein LOC131525802 isoform X2 [Onychostoma macrolepis]|uniref:uncharacterized protein LOC131525802 isoform X2 n=2 Tax=Onychostoma macrolepis TaxID=369639 RepID=UPI00272961A6|nr:uncharacterized protein LOC131525802 isoform X2 [Onychostoma macrolepis]